MPAVQSPQLTTTKSSPTTSYNAVGNTIAYSILVTNTGNVTLTNLAVTDASATLGSCSPASPVASLAPGVSISCPGSHTVTQADLNAGHYDNVASASGTNPAGGTTSDDSPTVSVPAVQSPQLTTTKSSPTTSYNAVGNTVAYSIVVTNSGNVTLTNVTATDANATLGSCSPASPVASLAPGASVACPATHTVTQTDIDAGHYDNVASASGTNPAGGTTSDDSPTVSVPAVQTPGIGIAKSSPTSAYSAVNGPIDYVITIVNTGNVTLSNVGVTDPNASFGSCAPSFPIITLAPGDAVTCLASHRATQADIDAGHYDNVASTSARTPAGATLTNSTPAVVVPATQTPSLRATKTAATPSFSAVGDIVTFSIHAVNDGNVTLSGVTVTDPSATLGSCTPAVPVASLAPNTVIDCTASRAATQADLDAGHVDNVARASGTSPAAAPVVADTPLATVPAVQNAALATTKSTSTASYAGAGDIISYTVTATNTGNVTLANATVADGAAVLGPCTPAQPVAALTPGATISCPATHTIVQPDVDAGHYDNVATSGATAPGGATVTAGSPVVTVNANRGASLAVTKTATALSYAAVGDVASYSIIARNSGNLTLSNVIVADAAATIGTCTPATPVASLAPGATITCPASHTVTQADLDAGRHDNVASASGTDPFGTGVSASSPVASVPATQLAQLTTTKTTPTGSYAEVGDPIVYAITVRNTGNVTLTAAGVSDPGAVLALCSPTLPVASLAPGAAITCLARHLATQADLDAGHYDNVANGNATDPGGAAVSSASPAVRVPAAGAPHLTVAKSSSTTAYGSVGATIGYTINVVNDGNVALTGVDVVDPGAVLTGCAPATPVATLARYATVTCNAARTVTQGDLDAGHYDNVASASGTDSGGTPATGSSPVIRVPADQSPHLVVTKTTSTPSYGFIGAPIDYTISVLNDGNVTIAGVVVDDPNATLGTCTPALPASIGSGATLVCPARHLATQADLDRGFVDNAAAVTGTDPGGTTVTAASALVTVTARIGPELTVHKTSTVATVAAVGDVVPYTITVQNTGNVALSPVKIVDENATFGSCIPALPIATLASGAIVTCAATHTVTQADIDAGKVVNVAKATGTVPGAPAVSAGSPAVETPVRQLPNLVLAKTASLKDDNGNGTGNVGETVSYVLTARNGGNVTLRGVAVVDAMFPNLACDRPQPTDLAPGASYACHGAHLIVAGDVVNGKVLNTATASGNSECSPGVVCTATVSDHAEAAVDAAPAALPRTGANVLRQLTLAAAFSVLGLLVLLAPLGRRRRGDDDATV